MTAQLFGLGAMTALFCIYQQTERRKMLVCKLIADICWVIHYALLGGTAGMIPNFIGIFRELVFVNRENKKWADKWFWPVLFILCSWTLGLSTCERLVDLLPIMASTFVTISLWLKNPKLTKLITLPVSAAFIIYDLYAGSVVGIINESLSIVSILISFIKLHRF